MSNKNILIERALEAVHKNGANRHQDPFRLDYHLMPPVGLLNDPNGFVYFKGRYHLFYQWNPFETKHGSKFWGHYSSTNLVTWREEPIALAPSDPFDKNGCYSGSAIEHDGKLYLFYTGNVKKENGERESYQCLATSEDGIHFIKKGPIINVPKGFTAHFRDPKVWKENDTWYMIIGAQDQKEQGCVVIYTSENLYDWKYEGVMTGSHRKNLKHFGYMWECPDLFKLQDKEVLLVCPQGLEADGFKYNNIFQSGYFIGGFNTKNITFNHGEFTELDRGFDFYAPQTTVDPKGRRLLFAWMGITDENESYHPTLDYNWVHAMTLPRELTVKNGKVYQNPVEELKQLRSNRVFIESLVLNNDQRAIEKLNGKSIEMNLSYINEQKLEEFVINIKDDAKIIYNTTDQTFILKRKSLINGEMEKRTCHVSLLNNLRIFIDTSSIELFINGGEEVFTARIFPDPENDKITFETKGLIQFDIEKWDIGKILELSEG